MMHHENETGIVQGGVASALALYFYDTLQIMLPFLILTVVLVIVDLYFGVQAARLRYVKSGKEDDRVRPSKAIRKTVAKIFEYLCWVILSASLSVSFNAEWINLVVMALVVGNEFISVLDNYLFKHGKKVTGIWSALMKLVGKKVGEDLSDIKIEEINENNS